LCLARLKWAIVYGLEERIVVMLAETCERRSLLHADLLWERYSLGLSQRGKVCAKSKYVSVLSDQAELAASLNGVSGDDLVTLNAICKVKAATSVPLSLGLFQKVGGKRHVDSEA